MHHPTTSAPRWTLWPVWIAINLIGSAIAANTIWRIGDLIPSQFAFGLVMGLVFGLTIGIGQWLIIRQRISYHGAWIVVTALVWVFRQPLIDLFGLPGIFLCGLILALSQWLVLRLSLSRAAWWILAAWLGWSIAQSIAGLSFVMLRLTASGYYMWVIVWSLSFGLVYGILTGGPIVWLLAHPLDAPPDAGSARPDSDPVSAPPTDIDL